MAMVTRYTVTDLKSCDKKLRVLEDDVQKTSRTKIRRLLKFPQPFNSSTVGRDLEKVPFILLHDAFPFLSLAGVSGCHSRVDPFHLATRPPPPY
jgi:hypothetical protein